MLAPQREIIENSSINWAISLSYEFCILLLYCLELKSAPRYCKYNPVKIFLLFFKVFSFFFSFPTKFIFSCVHSFLVVVVVAAFKRQIRFTGPAKTYNISSKCAPLLVFLCKIPLIINL